MILRNDYWYDVVPSGGRDGPIDGKWLVFGPTEQLHGYLSRLDELVEEGKVKAAKVARKLPDVDPFPEKPCVLCVFTADDETEKSKVESLIKNTFGVSPSAWKSDVQTHRDWQEGGWLALQAESSRLRRDIENGVVTDRRAARRRLEELTKRIDELARGARDDRRIEMSIGAIQAAATPPDDRKVDESLLQIVARLERIEAAIAARHSLHLPASVSAQIGKVFVVMPFAEEFEDTYLSIKRAVKTARPDTAVHRVDEHPGAVVITEEIHRSIEDAAVVVCDLTAERPNVYYELGFARGLRKPMLCIARDGTKLHFDVAGLRVIFFKTYGRLEETLTKEFDGLLPRSS